MKNKSALALVFRLLGSASHSTKYSGLEGIFDDHSSTDWVRAFKPDLRAYSMAMNAFGLRKAIAFAAFGGWDPVGAEWFGYPTFWVNRAHAAAEELGTVSVAMGILSR